MSTQPLAKLAILPVNKTFVFYSPIEGQDVLVRTGTNNDDGYSFLHAVLHASSAEYIKHTSKKRTKLAEELIRAISGSMAKLKWSEKERKYWEKYLEELWENVYGHISDRSTKLGSEGKKIVRDLLADEKSDKVYVVLVELVPWKEISNCLRESSYASTKSDYTQTVTIYTDHINTLVKTELDKFGTSLEEKRRQVCVDAMVSLSRAVMACAELALQRKSAKKAPEKTFAVDINSLRALSDHLKRDIYMMDGRLRLPYLIADPQRSQDAIHGRKSIIIMWMGGTHYEPIGRLLPADSDNKQNSYVQREFYADDHLIRRMKVFLFHPELVPEQYPNLIPYLNQNHRDQIGFTQSPGEKVEKKKKKKSRKHSESAEKSSRSASPSSASRSASSSDKDRRSESEQSSDERSSDERSSEEASSRSGRTKRAHRRSHRARRAI